MTRLSLLLLLSAITLTGTAQQNRLPFEVTPLTKNVYVHTTYQLFAGAPFPSNGLIIDTPDGVVLIDSGWGDKQTRRVERWVRRNLNKRVRLVICTHAHGDRMDGITYLQKRGARVIATPQTARLGAAEGFGQAEGTLSADTTFTFGNHRITTFYPGHGHTIDNIVVYLPAEQILFGGCLVKSPEATNMGNVADADLEKWPATIRNVQARFPEAEIIVPGHQRWEGNGLERTLELLKQE